MLCTGRSKPEGLSARPEAQSEEGRALPWRGGGREGLEVRVTFSQGGKWRGFTGSPVKQALTNVLRGRIQDT